MDTFLMVQAGRPPHDVWRFFLGSLVLNLLNMDQ